MFCRKALLVTKSRRFHPQQFSVPFPSLLQQYCFNKNFQKPLKKKKVLAYFRASTKKNCHMHYHVLAQHITLITFLVMSYSNIKEIQYNMISCKSKPTSVVESSTFKSSTHSRIYNNFRKFEVANPTQVIIRLY